MGVGILVEITQQGEELAGGLKPEEVFDVGAVAARINIGNPPLKKPLFRLQGHPSQALTIGRPIKSQQSLRRDGFNQVVNRRFCVGLPARFFSRFPYRDHPQSLEGGCRRATRGRRKMLLPPALPEPAPERRWLRP